MRNQMATDASSRARRRPKAAEEIAAVVRSDIVRGAVADGERLGSSNDLLERFGVSRPTLREALRILESELLITIEQGTYGGVVARVPTGDGTLRAMTAFLESRGVLLSDVYEARAMIEPVAARRLADMKGRQTKLRQLRSLIDRQQESIDNPSEFAKANVQFHERLVAAGGNETLVLIVDVLHDIVARAVTQLTELDSSSRGLERRQQGVDAQRQLLALIDKGDSSAAEAFWRNYMEIVGKIMLSGGYRAPVTYSAAS
jgi:GntR family transcriptional repressor for pyruvate dehydrogenase complex